MGVCGDGLQWRYGVSGHAWQCVAAMAERGSWPWAALGVADPRPWLLECDEPAARWVTFTGVLDRPADDPEGVEAHRAVVANAGTRALLDRIPDWTAGDKFGAMTAQSSRRTW
jgi:hypothetical protein